MFTIMSWCAVSKEGVARSKVKVTLQGQTWKTCLKLLFRTETLSDINF